MEDIKKNIEDLKTEIEKLSYEASFADEVMLLGATKTRTADEINTAIDAGLYDIAENRVQEFRDKFDFVKGGRWHFIGHLQKNKVKYIAGKVYLIHSVDSFELAEEINKKAEQKNIKQNILIQINKGEEESKNGVPLNEAEDLIRKIDGNLKNIKVLGLMAVMPIEDDSDILRKHFREVRLEFDRLKILASLENLVNLETKEPMGFENVEIKYLSMGMSGDYKEAIMAGSNVVRIGTAIFGVRNYL